jgi:hypothetical protein
MATIDYSSLTLTPKEAQVVNEAVFEKVFSAPEIAAVHDVQTGVDMDRFIPIFGQYGLVAKKDPGSCGSNTVASSIPVSQKKWEPILHSFRIAHCQDDVPNLLKMWQKSRKAAGTWEEVNDEMAAFIHDKALDATKNAILMLSSFGDTTASPVGDVTGNETLTVGTAKTFFNTIDGMWPQVFADQAGAAKIYRHVITENALATKAGQLALGTTTALDAMRGMFEGVDPRAFDGSNLVIQLTRSLFNNWQAMLEDKSLANAVFQKVEQGATVWQYRGYPIVIRNDWSRILTTYYDLGASYYLPHRAVLADISNIPIGTSDSESFKELRSFYDFKDKKHYMDVAFKLDMKILEEYAMAVAY